MSAPGAAPLALVAHVRDMARGWEAERGAAAAQAELAEWQDDAERMEVTAKTQLARDVAQDTAHAIRVVRAELDPTYQPES